MLKARFESLLDVGDGLDQQRDALDTLLSQTRGRRRQRRYNTLAGAQMTRTMSDLQAGGSRSSHFGRADACARATSALITTARPDEHFVPEYYLRSEARETRHRPVFVGALERPALAEWLTEKRRQEGKLRGHRNYPLSAEEAFASASEPYFERELVEAAQQHALPRSSARRGDRYVKAWDLGRKDASVCVVLRAPSREEAPVWHVVDYGRLVGRGLSRDPERNREAHAPTRPDRD